MNGLPPVLKRILAGLGLAGAFLLMASVFAPDVTRAQSVAPGSTDPRDELPSLGSIEDDRYVIEVHGGPSGPLYSVTDRATGRVEGVVMTAEETSARFPDLPIPEMDTGSGEMLMMAEPMPADLVGHWAGR